MFQTGRILDGSVCPQYLKEKYTVCVVWLDGSCTEHFYCMSIVCQMLFSSVLFLDIGGPKENSGGPPKTFLCRKNPAAVSFHDSGACSSLFSSNWCGEIS